MLYKDFSFPRQTDSDGIRQSIFSGGSTLFDITTSTTSAITVTGNSGLNRTYLCTWRHLPVVFDWSAFKSTIFDKANLLGPCAYVSNRTLIGGALQMVNNQTSAACSVSPSLIQWGSAKYNCPTSESWSGTCSSGLFFWQFNNSDLFDNLRKNHFDL